MRKIQCVFCDSAEVELFSLYGQTLLGSQYYCRNCKSIFEVVRFDDDDLEPDEKDTPMSGAHRDEQ
jgi:hypothetical protein